MTLVPVALRSQPLTRRLPLRALCAYTSDQVAQCSHVVSKLCGYLLQNMFRMRLCVCAAADSYFRRRNSDSDQQHECDSLESKSTVQSEAMNRSLKVDELMMSSCDM
jgi:hypothetical protein